jgi:hypothetical protein
MNVIQSHLQERWQKVITRSCFDRKLGNNCIAPMATGRASSESRSEERNREASAGPPPFRGSAVRSFTSCRPCSSLRKSIDNPALSATSKAAETAPFPANLSAKPSGSSLHSASTYNLKSIREKKFLAGKNNQIEERITTSCQLL